MNDFYDKLEENIILCLQSKHPAIEKELYPKILMYFRTLNFNEKLLRFLYQMLLNSQGIKIQIKYLQQACFLSRTSGINSEKNLISFSI